MYEFRLCLFSGSSFVPIPNHVMTNSWTISDHDTSQSVSYPPFHEFALPSDYMSLRRSLCGNIVTWHSLSLSFTINIHTNMYKGLKPRDRYSRFESLYD